MNSSLGALAIKILGCSVVVGAATGIPLGALGKANETQVISEEKIIFPPESLIPAAKKTITLINSSTSGGKLNLKNLDKLLAAKNTNRTISFRELGMTMGDQELSENDLLVSPWQNSTYYLAKYDRFSGGYRLGNGQIEKTFRRNDQKYKNLDHVVLKWHHSARTGSISPSLVPLKTCTFKLKGDERSDVTVIIQCKDSLYNGQTITGTFSGKVQS